MKICLVIHFVLVGEGCENFSARQITGENFSARQITLRDLVTLANVISWRNNIGGQYGLRHTFLSFILHK